jgi:hypothetical protein
VHVDLAQWHPDPYVFEATPEAWRRAFEIAHLRQAGISSPEEIAPRLGVTPEEVEADARLIPYLDRTVAGLLSVLGWYVDSTV